jgi:hypothetical protein
VINFCTDTAAWIRVAGCGDAPDSSLEKLSVKWEFILNKYRFIQVFIKPQQGLFYMIYVKIEISKKLESDYAAILFPF